MWAGEYGAGIRMVIGVGGRGLRGVGTGVWSFVFFALLHLLLFDYYYYYYYDGLEYGDIAFPFPFPPTFPVLPRTPHPFSSLLSLVMSCHVQASSKLPSRVSVHRCMLCYALVWFYGKEMVEGRRRRKWGRRGSALVWLGFSGGREGLLRLRFLLVILLQCVLACA